MHITNARLGTCLLFAMLTIVSGLALAAGQPRAPEKSAPKDDGQAANPERFVPPAIPFFTPIDEHVLTLAFSPDGKKLVTAGARFTQPGQLKVWDVPTGRELLWVRGFPGVRSIAWSPDGRTLATGDFSGSVRLRDAATGAERAAVKGHQFGINAVAFSPDGRLLVSAGLDRIAKLWDAATLQEQKAFLGHGDMVLSATFFRHGLAFVTTSKDKTAIIWDVATGEANQILRGHQAWVETAAISPDEKILATGSWDKTIRLCDAESGVEKGKLEGHEAPVLAVVFSPDGQWLASAGYDLTIRIWDVAKQKLLGPLGKHNQAIWALAFSRAGVLASGGDDTTAKLWNVAAKKEIAILPTSDRKPINALAYSPDGKRVAVAKQDNRVHLCDAKTGDLLHVLRGHAGVVTCLAFSASGDTLASGSDDKTVKLWDTTTGETKHTLAGRPSAVKALAFTPDGKKLAVGCDDGSIQWCNPVSGAQLETSNPNAGPIHALACAPDGRLALGGDDPVIKVFNPDKKGTLDALRGHAGPVRTLAFDPSGVLASAGDDGIIRVWERAQAKEQFALKGHEGAVSALAFSSSGQCLVSGGTDGTVRQWDPRTGEPRSVLRQHSAPVTALAMHPGGADVLSGGQDTLLLRWPRAASGFPPLPLLFRHDFRGTTVNEQFLRFTTNKAPTWFVQEAEGLRVSPPIIVPRTGPSGVTTAIRLHGDFDVTASYELLQAPIFGPGNQIGVSLYLVTDTPTQDAVMLARFNKRDGSFYTCSGKMTTPVGKQRQYPPGRVVRTDAMSGQLRLVRQGTTVRFLVEDEGADGFQELHRVDLGDEDALSVRLAVDPGNKDSPPVVGRFRAIEVRGQVGVPKAAPSVVGKNPDNEPVLKKVYAQEYSQSFTERLEKITGWGLMTPNTDPEVQTGPQGLRITMPLGHEKRRQGVGLASDFGVKGDFEITLRYEILGEPDPAVPGDGGTGLSLRVDLDEPTRDLTSLTRCVMPREGDRFTSLVWNSSAGKAMHWRQFPAQAKTGRLRMVRTGAMVSCYVAEGARDDFVFFHALPFGDADLTKICIVGSTGGPNTSLDVRVTDFHIRADSIPSMSAPAGAGSAEWWIVGLLAVLAGVCLIALALVAWLFLRHPHKPVAPIRGTAKNKPAKAEPITSIAPATNATKNKPLTSEALVFRCTDCGKSLKARPELAGKKVKCTQCGKAVPVPVLE